MESIGILGQPGGLQGFPVPVPRNPGAREHDVNAGLRLRVQAPGFFFLFFGMASVSETLEPARLVLLLHLVKPIRLQGFGEA